VLLIPGTSSVSHLDENMAVTDIASDDGTRQQLDAVA
jgi:pyridoxine 4-dehydrogenase